jgi:hypothetical protein
MSTFAYAALTSRREDATPGTSSTGGQPGVSTYVDAVAALVPAEVLTAHGVILSFTTETTAGAVHITAPDVLRAVFWVLIGLSCLLYVVTRWTAHKWERLDYLRMLIPPVAFVAWTMLQKATAFDAVDPKMSDPARSATAIIVAIVLGVSASLLAYKADQKP